MNSLHHAPIRSSLRSLFTGIDRRGIVAWICVLAATASCSKPEPPPVAPTVSLTIRDPFLPVDGELVEEYWELHRIRGAKVGHRHTRIERIPGSHPPVLRIESQDSLELRRFRDVTQQDLTLVSVESPEGEVQQLAYRVRNGDSQRSVLGHVTQDRLEITRETTDATTGPETYAWPNGQGSMFAVERSLRRQPLPLGESRIVQVFVPLLDQVAQLELKAVGSDSVDVGSGPEQVTRIEAAPVNSDTWQVPTQHWTRADGTIVRTLEGFLDRETIRATEADAKRPNDSLQVDLGIDVAVRVAEPIPDPDGVLYAVYRVRIPGYSPERVFATGVSQHVLPSDDGTSLITVSQVSPDYPAELAATDREPTLEDTAPNPIIQSDHPRVVALAKAVSGQVDDPWRIATLLERHLFRTLGKLDFSQVFSPAGEVAEKKQGDCSEHAVLLAAVCRARQIPARVAIGLLYSADEQSFQYHMWTEVWIRDRWVPLDATLGQGGVGGCHIKLRDSNLAHQTAYGLVSPVIHLIGKLEIETVTTSNQLPEE